MSDLHDEAFERPDKTVAIVVRSIVDRKLLSDFSWSRLTTKRRDSSIRFLNERPMIVKLIKGTCMTLETKNTFITLYLKEMS